jgi:putative peptide zinc metalloprotease protein
MPIRTALQSEMASRPCPFQARADLIVRAAGYEGDSYWLVKDPLSLEYHRLHPVQYAILKRLDGTLSLEQIQQSFLREFPTQRISLQELHSLLADFHERGLVVSDHPGQADVLLERSRESWARRIRQTLGNLLYIKLPGWDPDRALARLYPWAGWLFSMTGVCAGLAFVIAAWCWLIVDIAEFERELPALGQFFGWPNLGWLWLTLGVAKVLHELGHGLACRRMGGECHEIGIAFLMFSPCLYCDVSDSWMLPRKWRRIAVASAGMYVELMISAIGILVWRSTQPGLVHFLALQTFLVTTFTTVMLNANPLLQFDGYYILSDLLEVPNLRTKSDRLLVQTAAKTCLGFEWPADPFMPQRGRFWFVIYALASAVYRATVLFSIAFVLYELLRPVGLQNLALLAVAAILFRAAKNMIRVCLVPRIRPMNILRTMATSGLAAAGLAALFLIPIPYRMEFPFTVEAHEARQVYASTSGRLSRVAVQPGQHVEKGDLLFELTNFPQQDLLVQLRSSLKVQQVELKLQRKLNDAAGIQRVEQQISRLAAQIREYEDHLVRLTVLAPCSGTVVAPPARRAPVHSNSASAERQWSGTPLDPQNSGAWIETGVHLASIAPDDRREARVIIDQHQRNDIQVGATVELKCICEPGITRTGSLVAIADRDVETVPSELSNKFGGPVPTLTAGDGHERLLTPAFEGLVELPDAAVHLLPGMQGRARLTICHRTAAQWVWRWSLSTLRFRS